ncbi:MAG: LysM peptidoglycan-binding domain-containing protein [Candidatus Didemnitutus sp.]|nr:LysM peptidoglycan-binding domain-containing protein [Candidatus Didemnitutus sp.]
MPTTNLSRFLLAAFLGLTLPGVLNAAPAADGELARLTIKAEQGNAIAQYNLGLAYAEGQGVAKDPMEAFVWLSIALENGARGRALDSLIARLSSAELATGRQLLAQRRAALGLIPVPVPTVAPTATPDTSTVVDAAEQLRRERDALSTKITDLVGEIAALRGERDISQSLAAQSKQEAAAARLLSETVQASAQDAARRTIELQQQISQLQVAAAQPPSYPDLRARVSSLEAEIATVRATPPPFADQREQVASLEVQLTAVTQQATDHQARLTELSAVNRTVASELDALRVQLTERSQQAEAAEAEAHQLRAENSALTAAASAPRETPAPAYPDLRDRVAELETEIATVRATPPPFADQREQVQSLEAQLTTAREQVATSETRAASLNDAHRGVESELQALTAQLARLQQQSDAAEAETVQLKAAHDAAMVQAQTAISEANEVDRTAQEKVRLAETRIGELTQQVAQLQAATAAQVPAPTYPDLRDRVTELEAEIATVRATPPPFADQREQVQTLAAQLAVAAQEAGTHATRFAALHEAKTGVDSELQTLRTQLADSREQTAVAQAAAERLQGENQALAAQTQTEIAAATNLSRAAHEQVQLAEARVAELTQRIAQLEAATTAQPNAPADPDLRDRVTELEAEIATVRATPPPFADQREQVQTLAAQLAAAAQEAATNATRFAALHEAKAAVDSELQTVRTQLALGLQQVDEAQEHVRLAEGRVAELRQQLARAPTAAPTEQPASPAYPDLRERVSELEAQVVTLRDAPAPGADLREQVQTLEAQLASAQQQLATSEKRFAAFTEAKNGVDAELQTVRAQLANRQQPVAPSYPDLRERVSDLEAQVVALRDAPPAFSDQRAQVQNLEAQLAQALQQVSTGASRIAALTTARDGTGLELQTLRAQLTSSQQQAEAAQAAANKLLAENRTLVAAAAAPREIPAPTYPDLRDRVVDLESQLAGVAPAPAYPNLQPQVAALEASLAATRSELEAARAAASAVPVAAEPAPDLTDKLEEAETRLAISLRSFLQLQREHDALLGRTNQAANEKSTERDNLTARLAAAEAATTAAQAESTRLGQALAALQRSGTQAGSEAAALRALLAQVQGANDVLARENYELKTARAPAPLPVPVAAVVVTADRVHTVEPADTLSLISNRYYGTPGRWQEIFNANRDVIDAQGTLRVGMKLRIP